MVEKKPPNEDPFEFNKNYTLIGRGLYYIIPPPPFVLNYPPEDTVVSLDPLEPQSFSDFIGQPHAKEILRIIIEAANKEGRFIPNTLLTGPYGHGKTTLAKLISKYNQKKFKVIDGVSVGVELALDRDIIYIIDEAHNIPSQVTDSFNILIDSKKLNIIACTTNPGALPAPFRSRFRTIYLESYEEKDIYNILMKASRRSHINITVPSAKVISERSKLNPRVALSILEFVREIEIATNKNPNKKINIKMALMALEKLGVDSNGFNILDRKYLEILSDSYPVGMQYITSLLSIDSNTVQDEIEPYLLKRGVIQRTPKGRIRTKPIVEVMEGENKAVTKEQIFAQGLSQKLLSMLEM
jgi:Holliday junction DNA helicase RuvB